AAAPGTAEKGKDAAAKAVKDAQAALANAKKGLSEKDPAKKAAAEKSVKEVTAKVAAASKALADKEAVAVVAARGAVDAKTAYDKAIAARTAATKNFSAKNSANTVAIETVHGGIVFDAMTAVDDLVKEIVAAQKAVAKLEAPAKKAKDLYVAAKGACDKANTEKVAAEKALAGAAEKGKAAAKKVFDGKTTACKAATAKLAAAKAAAEKASAALASAGKVIPGKKKELLVAQDKHAAARADALGGLAPMPSGKWTPAKARHLLVRAAFGGTPKEVRELYEMGVHDAVDHLVEIYQQPVADIELDPMRLHRPEPWENRLAFDERRVMTIKFRNPERAQQAQLRRWWLKRMAESPRPLQEKMTLFWHDHFSVQYRKRTRTYMLYKQNQLFRTYGTDNFSGLLRGIIHDPAMIAYLDNHVNYKDSGNENLGREILELFSMGEGRGYTEEDLREASRALTGYTFDSWTTQFKFLATRHDGESKKIFGSTGNWGGDDLVDLILRQSTTAEYVTEKIFSSFAYEDFEPEAIEKLAHVMRYCGYDLRPMLKNLFLSEEFYSKKAMGTHIKGPVELAVGAIRDLGMQELVNYGTVDAAVNQMGQYLFEPPNVAGWNENRTWINAERILVRYNQMARIVDNPSIDILALIEGQGLETPQKVVDELARACLVVTPAPEKSKELAKYLGELPPADQWEAKRSEINGKLRAILVLLLSIPESQVG
ncbi:MAG: DUF1800 family protein, partial [Verrucomicrobiales bacterium]